MSGSLQVVGFGCLNSWLLLCVSLNVLGVCLCKRFVSDWLVVILQLTEAFYILWSLDKQKADEVSPLACCYVGDDHVRHNVKDNYV